MKSRIRMINQCLHAVYDMAVAVLLVMFLQMCFASGKAIGLYTGLTLLFFLISFVVQMFAKRGWQYFLVHMLMLLSVSRLPGSIETKVCFCVVPMYLLLKGLIRKKEEDSKNVGDLPWPSFLFCLVVYLVGNSQGQKVLVTSSYLVAMLLLFLYFAMVYVDGVGNYLSTATQTNGVPIKEILSTNTTIVFLVMICLFVGLLLGDLFNVKQIFVWIGAVFMAIFRIVARAYGFIWTIIALWFRRDDDDRSQNPVSEGEGAPPVYESPAESFEILLYLLLIVLVVFACYKLLQLFVKYMLSRRSLEGNTMDTIEVIKPATQNHRKKQGKKRFLSSEEKARRYYRQCILRYRHEISLSCDMTSRRIAKQFEEKELRDVTELTRAYEEIRYAGKQVDREVLKNMNRLSKNL